MSALPAFRVFASVSRHPSRISGRRALHVGRAMSEKSVLVPIANGSEEMEAVIIYDVLVRCALSPPFPVPTIVSNPPLR